MACAPSAWVRSSGFRIGSDASASVTRDYSTKDEERSSHAVCALGDPPGDSPGDGANILVGVNATGAHIGQAIRDAMQRRIEVKKRLVNKRPF